MSFDVPISQVLFELLPQGDLFQADDEVLRDFLAAVAHEFERVGNLPIPLNLPPVPAWDEILTSRNYTSTHGPNESSYFGPLIWLKKLRSGFGKSGQVLSKAERDEAFIQAIEATKPAHVQAHHFPKEFHA